MLVHPKKLMSEATEFMAPIRKSKQFLSISDLHWKLRLYAVLKLRVFFFPLEPFFSRKKKQMAHVSPGVDEIGGDFRRSFC